MATIRARTPRIEAGTLSGLPALSSLSNASRTTIAASFHGYRYSARETIIAQAQLDQRVCFVVSGSVRVTFYAPRGRIIGFRDLGPGAMFGELSAIDRKPRSAQVIATKETLIAWMSHESFREILRRYPEVTDYVLQHLTQLVRRLSDRVVEFGTLSVNNRIHAEILRLAREVDAKSNEVLLLPAPTRNEIADRICTHREAVSRELTALVRMKVIERAHRTLVIKDMKRLEQMVHEVSGG